MDAIVGTVVCAVEAADEDVRVVEEDVDADAHVLKVAEEAAVEESDKYRAPMGAVLFLNRIGSIVMGPPYLGVWFFYFSFVKS